MQGHGVPGIILAIVAMTTHVKSGHRFNPAPAPLLQTVIPNRPDRVYSICLLVGAQARLLAVGVLLTAQSVVADLLFRGLGIEEVLAMAAVMQIGIGSR